jgi:hypothetical protein
LKRNTYQEVTEKEAGRLFPFIRTVPSWQCMADDKKYLKKRLVNLRIVASVALSCLCPCEACC